MLAEMQKETKEAEILSEIRDAEKKSGEAIEKARIESESILREASKNSSSLLGRIQEDIIKSKEKRIADFREKLRLIREEKLNEASESIMDIKSKAEKNIPKAIEHILEKFEEGI